MTNDRPPGEEKISEPTLKKLDEGSIKLISAGEKISDIETVVRELIENSIDAEAKNIEVRLIKFGVECIEVHDDGTGIDEVNFKNLGLRYHTSKIKHFSKLQESLETFGFRGEALSCLCSLSNVTITTKTKSSPTGTKLIFSKTGELCRSDLVARGNGTTISVKNLFYTLPVRKRELEQTAKRQYDKVVKLIYEQVLARPQIKFTLCKKDKLDKKNDFTHGGTTLEGCIITIFGIKMLDSLIPIKQSGVEDFKPEEKKEEIEGSGDENTGVITALKAPEKEAQNLDEEVDKVSAILVESIDDILLTKDDFETTVAPDREEFFKRRRKSKLRREKVIFTIYGYISKLGMGRNAADCQFIFVNKKPCDIPRVSRVMNEVYRNYSSSQSSPFFCLFIQVQSWATDFNVPRKRAVILQDENKLCDIIRESLDLMYSPMVQSNQKFCPIAQIPLATPKYIANSTPSETPRHSLSPTPMDSSGSAIGPPPVKTARPTVSPTALETPRPAASSKPMAMDFSKPVESPKPTSSSRTVVSPRPKTTFKSTVTPKHLSSPTPRINPWPEAIPGPVVAINPDIMEQEQLIFDGRLQIKVTHPEALDKAMERERAQRRIPTNAKEFSFAIHPNFNVVAEQELKCNLNKKSFEDMLVLGQFNRGFILARLDKHVFIIDQHATDERANYEEQLKKSPLFEQKMVYPKPLYFNSIQENAIINNLEEFKKKGFQFVVDEEKPAGFRVLLSATSICKGQGMDEHLTREDLEELIDVVLDSPNSFGSYTLKKVRNVAASRACRKSVMIGDKLSWSQMCDIVFKMSTLENPWICAHNRPTIRHLMDVDWMHTD